MADSNICILCGRKFTARKNLYAHYRGVHKIQPRTRATIQCPNEGCRFSCNFLANLRIHVEKEHNTVMEKEIILFDTPEEFQEWKSKEEKETKSSFVQHCGAKRTKDGAERITYVCHRSGKFQSSSTGKRLLKSQGSIKLGSHCTAAIELHREESGSCTVVYFKTHFGHEQHIGLLQLSRADREAIARQIAKGVPFEKILEDVKSSIHSGEPERLHLITRRDLHNIKRGQIAKGVPFEKILDDVKSSIHSGEPERLHLITRRDLHNIKRDFGIGSSLQQDIDEVSGHDERLDTNASLSRRLEFKLQVLRSRIRSGIVSKETKCKVEKEVDRLLLITQSDFRRRGPHSPKNEKRSVLRTPDKPNIPREVPHCANNEKLNMPEVHREVPHCPNNEKVKVLRTPDKPEVHREVPHCPNNGKLKVLQVPDKSNIHKEVPHCPNTGKLKVLQVPNKSNIPKEVPQCPNNEKLKVLQVPDKSNIHSEVPHFPNKEKLKRPIPIRPKIFPKSVFLVPIPVEKLNFVVVKQEPDSEVKNVHVSFDHTYCQS